MIFGSKQQQNPQVIVLGSTKKVSNMVVQPRSVSLLTLVLCIFFLGSLFLVVFTYRMYKEVIEESTILRTQAEVELVISRVARLLDVPTDEIPLIARVSDPAQLPKDSFFSSAQQGDRILVYCNAEKSILYSPTRDKLIGVYPQALPGVCQ